MTSIKLRNPSALKGKAVFHDGWVSLGGGCQVAYRLREYGLRRRPTALDWVRTPAQALPELIENDLAGLLDAQHLVLAEGSRGPTLVHRRLGIVFPHDTSLFIRQGYRGLAERYEPRIRALVELLDPSRTVVFVRRRAEPEVVASLSRVLAHRSPNSSLLVIDDGAAASWPPLLPANVAWARTPSMGGEWTGCGDVWDAMLSLTRDGESHLSSARLRRLADGERRWSAQVLGNDWDRVSRSLRAILTWRADDLDSVPQVLLEALVAAEDHRFRSHPGVDPVATTRALYGIATKRRLGGGSTIEQQLFRVLSGRYQNTPRRKMRELLGALQIARCLSKELTARCYLCVAYFGHEMNGINEVCRRLRYALDKLSPFEAADIVARLKYPEPSVLSPLRANAISRRRDHILVKMGLRPC